MIRYLWVAAVSGIATVFFGLIAIGASLLRVRGPIYFWCTQQWGRTILRASGSRVVVSGMESVDWSAPHVLVSNHISGYDIYALAAVIPVPFHFVGKKELNRIPLFGTAWRAAGHVSIDRSNRARAIASLKKAGERIRRERGIVIVFPEGTRSRTGTLQPFKKGAFIMAAEAGLAVLPAVVQGSDRVKTPGKPRVDPGPIHVRFGAPVDAAAYGPARVDELSAEVRGRMVRLLASDSA